MSKTQIWVAAFLGMFLILFILSKVLDSGEELGNNEEGYSETQSLDAMTLINNNGCVSCHGQDLKGTNLGPSLYGMNEFWSRDNLIGYLRNPSSFMDSDRFNNYKEKYKNIIMPSYNNVDVKDLGKISDYLLNLKQ